MDRILFKILDNEIGIHVNNTLYKIVEIDTGLYVIKYSLYNILKLEFIKGVSNASGALIVGGVVYFGCGILGYIYEKYMISNKKTHVSTMAETENPRKRKRISSGSNLDTETNLDTELNTYLDTDLDTDSDSYSDTESDTESECDRICFENKENVLEKNIRELFN